MWGCERGADSAGRAPTDTARALHARALHARALHARAGGTHRSEHTDNVSERHLSDTKSVANNSNSEQNALENRFKSTNSDNKSYNNQFIATKSERNFARESHPDATRNCGVRGNSLKEKSEERARIDRNTQNVNSVFRNRSERANSVRGARPPCPGTADCGKSDQSRSSVPRVCRNRPAAGGGCLLLLLLVLLSLRSSAGPVSLGAQLVCAKAPGLTEKQRALCRASPAAMAAIADGLRMAYAECRAQLGGRRWNCSGVGDGNHFGHVMPWATREAAFTYAITSAGAAHALGAACARGDLPACPCSSRRRAVTPEQWEWGGAGGSARCGEAAYGARLARRFLDARELERDARAAMNLHNNRLGRKIVKDLVRRECKCHGVSGSCAVRTCWRALPPFGAVGAALRDKYSHAKQVSAIEGAATVDGRVNIQLVVKRARQPLTAPRPARKSELVFLSPSPTYCEPDPAVGSPGTHGRRCNSTSRGEDGCESLCCGRGHSTQRRAARVQCRCRFQWCCRVRCDTCTQRSELHLCN